jgi:Flp pilus assembly protein TadG
VNFTGPSRLEDYRWRQKQFLAEAMFTYPVLKRLCRSAAAFVGADRGNIAVIFAITMVPIMGFIGSAVDYSRAVNARTAMQTALDTAALMISKDAPTLTATQVTQTAQKYFNALYNHPEVASIAITAAYTAASGSTPAKVVLTGTGSVTTDFMKVAGYPSLNFNVGSTTSWSNTKLRVAMALDNTGSMAASGKMDALQGGASSLVDQLSASAQTDGDVYISLVPFSKDVNVKSSNYSQSWLDFSDWDNNNQTCSGNGWNQNCSPKNHNTWTGCVTDRDQSYDTLNTAPTTANSSTLFPADEYYENGVYYCKTNNPQGYLQPITPLSYNWTTLKSNINAMQPTGGTNQSIGLAWAWMSLTQSSPLNAPALDPNYQYTQVIILLSDGLNTEDRWYGDGMNPAPQVDARQKILCDNIKAAGIKIYAIQVNTDGSAQSSVMAYCASGAANFFYLTSANQILTTFNSIGTSLSKLHIAK